MNASHRSLRSHASPAVIATLDPPLETTGCMSPPLRAEGQKWVRGSNKNRDGNLLEAGRGRKGVIIIFLSNKQKKPQALGDCRDKEDESSRRTWLREV